VSEKDCTFFKTFSLGPWCDIRILCPRERRVFQSKLGASCSNQCNLHHSPHTGHLGTKNKKGTIFFGHLYSTTGWLASKRSWSYPIHNFLHSPLTPSFLCPNMFLSVLFSNTHNLCSPVHVTDQDSTRKKIRKIMFLIILIFMFCSQFVHNNIRKQKEEKIAETKNMTSAHKTSDGRREKKT
jgi:hypothetical protein